MDWIAAILELAGAWGRGQQEAPWLPAEHSLLSVLGAVCDGEQDRLWRVVGYDTGIGNKC